MTTRQTGTLGTLKLKLGTVLLTALFAAGAHAQTYLPNGSLPEELAPAQRSLKQKSGIPRLETALSELYMNRTLRSAMSTHSSQQVEKYLLYD